MRFVADDARGVEEMRHFRRRRRRRDAVASKWAVNSPLRGGGAKFTSCGLGVDGFFILLHDEKTRQLSETLLLELD